MSVDSHSDFYKFSWHVVHHNITFNKSFYLRSAILFVMFLISLATVYLIDARIGVGPHIFLWFMVGMLSLIFLIIGFFWNKISNEQQKVQVIYYQLDNQGFKIGNKLISFEKFDPKDIEEVSQNLDEHIQTTNNLIKLNLPLNSKRQTVWFNSEAELKRCLKSLSVYLKP